MQPASFRQRCNVALLLACPRPLTRRRRLREQRPLPPRRRRRFRTRSLHHRCVAICNCKGPKRLTKGIKKLVLFAAELDSAPLIMVSLWYRFDFSSNEQGGPLYVIPFRRRFRPPPPPRRRCSCRSISSSSRSLHRP